MEHTKRKATAVDAAAKSAGGAPQDTQKMIHTRSCNRREVCSCFLRLQSAYFQKNLVAVAKRRKKKQQQPREDEQVAPGGLRVAALKSEASDNESSTATPSKKKRAASTRRYRAVMNLQLFDIEAKQLISMFLQPAELAKLSMVRGANCCCYCWSCWSMAGSYKD